MPGIAGIFSQRPAHECESLVKSMVGSMEHEQFYVSGSYAAPEMGVYAGWVAHENSFAAGQVFFNERKDIALLLSGECFPDLETRAELKRKGHELGEAAGVTQEVRKGVDDIFFSLFRNPLFLTNRLGTRASRLPF